MLTKRLFSALIALLLLTLTEAIRSRRPKRPNSEVDETTPQSQPNVVTYSTFGFNDVSSYDGFVPSSPDYINNLNSYNKNNQESSTRLYAPAFPTALDTINPNYGYGSPQTAQDTSMPEMLPQPAMIQYHPNGITGMLNTPETEAPPNIPEVNYRHSTSHGDDLVYGSKIGSKDRDKFLINPLNQTGYTQNAENNENKLSRFQVHATFDNKQQPNGESNSFYHNQNRNTFNNPSGNSNDFIKPVEENSNSLKFPKVVDFTKVNQYYPTEVDTKYLPSHLKMPANVDSPTNSQQNQNSLANYFNAQESQQINYAIPFGNDQKHNFDKPEDKENYPSNMDLKELYQFNRNYSALKNLQRNPKPKLENKEKSKVINKWTTNMNNYYGNDPQGWVNPLKGYEYSDNFSSISFKYDETTTKKPFNIENFNFDEVTPESSSDIKHYQIPENDFSNFKKFPGVKAHYDDEYVGVQSGKYQNKYSDYINNYKNFYNSLSTSHWGNSNKAHELPDYKQYHRKPQFTGEINDEVVNIPKKPYASKYTGLGKYFEKQPNEWQSPKKPNKLFKPQTQWLKDFHSGRFKSEEDLLGLRTRDTSNPAYVPTYRPINEPTADDDDFKKLVSKWRQNYWKSKHRDIAPGDFDGYASDAKPVHVPVPKPYPIEIPHPVIVPVLQPYPVRVPIPKPVAVPVIKELMISIEKPVPYAVVKNVPYPVEKHVPVTVVKQVAVPVMKPYPVPVPHIRPVFHHGSRPGREEYEREHEHDMEEEDDYFPRPESSDVRGKKALLYSNKTRYTRNRPHKLSRESHQDRNRRLTATKRPPSMGYDRKPRRKPSPSSEYNHRPTSHRYREYEPEQEYEDPQYLAYCKRSGNC